jgi:hypothetical protein
MSKILLFLVIWSVSVGAGSATLSDYCAGPPSLVERIICGSKDLIAFSQRPGVTIDRKALDNLAEKGDIAAQIKLGILYRFGHGAPIEPALALSWFYRAASQGDDVARTLFATMCLEGVCSPRGYSQAVEWLRLAASHGNSAAQYVLGTMYEMGLGGVDRDPDQALAWYGKSAAQGNAAGLAAKSRLETKIPKPEKPPAPVHPIGEMLSAGEQRDVLNQILPLIKIDPNNKDIQGMSIDAVIEINADGTLMSPHNRDGSWNPGSAIRNYQKLVQLGATANIQMIDGFLLAIRMSQPLKVDPGGTWPKWMHVQYPPALP